MRYNPRVHNRHSIRLKGYDYSQAAFYFITICTQHREHFFGEIGNRKMILNDAGVMIQTVWDEIPEYYKGINIHTSQIMPDHIHGIIQIMEVGSTPPVGAPYPKIVVTRHYASFQVIYHKTIYRWGKT